MTTNSINRVLVLKNISELIYIGERGKVSHVAILTETSRHALSHFDKQFADIIALAIEKYLASEHETKAMGFYDFISTIKITDLIK